MIWTLRGFATGDAVVIRVADGKVSCRFNDDAASIEVGSLPVDGVRVEAMLIHCAARAVALAPLKSPTLMTLEF